VSTISDFAQREVFDRLGMDNSLWPGETLATSWNSNLRDMARLGLLLIHNGVWDQSRLLSENWVYKMTHPSFEDASISYGYLTWLAAKVPGLCQPSALWPEYPHPISESTDCNYGGTVSCMQTHDVGVFGAAGAGGQLIVGHRGLDLVIVTRNAGLPPVHIATPWALVRRALIEHDPLYSGNEEAFCAAYEVGDYAPDLITAP
jgi:CubicO group peptidase (beta-lactamase class C family)